jgi:nucleoside-diphosphate-sugar epimerase
MSRILVTGATGFIGRAVIAAFADTGPTLRAAVRQLPQPSFPDGVEVMRHPDLAQSDLAQSDLAQTNLAQRVDWRSLVEGVDQVIHLAGIAHTGRGVDPELYDCVNRLATAQIAAAAARAGVSRFVFVSSIRAQTGPAADHALTEHDPEAPTDAYGRSKLAAEEAVRSSGVPFTILRPVLLYGPGVKGNFATLLRAAISPWPLPIKSLGNRRSLLGIDNFVSALNFVLSAPAARGETYVVADPGIPPRLADIVAILREAQGRRPLLLPMPLHYAEIPLRMMRRADLWERFGGDLRVDPRKLIAAGWRPAHDTPTGLARMVRTGTPQKAGASA